MPATQEIDRKGVALPVPTRIKAIIYGALGYFLLPLNVIPDVIPG